MWNNFNEIAEGFGLNVNEFVKIVDIEGLKATAQDARAVFKAFDTDSVGVSMEPCGVAVPCFDGRCAVRWCRVPEWTCGCVRVPHDLCADVWPKF